MRGLSYATLRMSARPRTRDCHEATLFTRRDVQPKSAVQLYFIRERPLAGSFGARAKFNARASRALRHHGVCMHGVFRN